MKNILLIDYGATRVKSISVALTQSNPDSREFSTKGSSFLGCRIDNKFFSNSLIKHLKAASKKTDISGVVICSEMHGFCYKYKNYVSEYFSWRFNSSNSNQIITQIKEKEWFKNIKIYPRVGLPLVNLLSFCQQKLLKNNTEILFIPQIICNNLGKSYGCVHPTLGQSSGLYLKNKDINKILKTDIKLPKPTQDDFPLLGEICVNGKILPVWGGYGDLQAALYCIKKNTWNINLGTGSQLVYSSNQELDGFEERAFFDNQNIQCISHLPAGRSLNLFADLLRNIRDEKDNSFFWNKVKLLTFDKKIFNINNMKVDLNFFEQNRNFKGGGSVIGLNEKNFNINDMLLSVIISMTKNFIDIILDSKKKNLQSSIYIYGDLINKIPIMKDIIQYSTKNKVTIKSYSRSPTLINMKKILLKNI